MDPIKPTTLIMTVKKSRIPKKQTGEVLELLPPGSFAKFTNQPNDLPPFQVIDCKGGRCRVRQQTWGRYVHWEVEHNRLKSA